MDRINASSFMGYREVYDQGPSLCEGPSEKSVYVSSFNMSPLFSQILFWTDDVCTILGQAIKLETGHLCLRWESKAKESLNGVGQRQAGLTSEKAES